MFNFLKLSAYLDTAGAGTEYTPVDDEPIQLMKVDQMKIFKSVNEIILVLQENQAESCLKLYL